MTLEEEEKKVTGLLKGKIVKTVRRYNENEIIIKFDEGIEIFVYGHSKGINLSIADSNTEEDNNK